LEEVRKSTFAVKKNRVWLPDIAISRDPGSGGRVVAEMVAEKLGWKLYDKQFLVELSRELGIPEKEFANIDEHPRGWVIDLLQSIFNPNYISDTTYLRHLGKLIVQAGKTQQIVLLGRGAGFLLPSDKCLRVRVTAPFTSRVVNTMKYEGKTRFEAEDWVRKVQAKRDRFIRQYFGRTARWVSNYDVVVNTEYLNLQAARDVIIAAYYCKFPEIRRK